MRTALRVLFLEDNANDIELERQSLEAAEFDVISDIAVTLEQFKLKLRANLYDVILSDFRMPNHTGMECIETFKAAGIDTPFILVTGSLGDEKAVECLKEGAADYVLKDRLARLPVAVHRALEEQRLKAERVATEEALRRSEASYRSLIENAPCGILRVDAQEGYLLQVNPALSEMLGYESPAELLRHSAAGNITLAPELLRRLANGSTPDGQVMSFETEWKRRDGAPVLIELRGRLLRDENQTPCYIEMMAEDLTTRRRAEQRIRQLNRLYSVLSHAGQTIVAVRNRDELFREICRVVVEEGNFRMAWIGLTEPNCSRVKPVASWGVEQDYLRRVYVTTEDGPCGRGPVGTAIRERRHVLCNEAASDPRMERWREHVDQLRYGSAGAFPLIVNGEVVGALAICALDRDYFDDETIALLDKLAENLSFAIESIDAAEERQRISDELNQFFTLSPDMLSISDFQGNALRVNPAWEQTLGFSISEFHKKSWPQFVHPEDRPKALAVVAGFAQGKSVNRMELRFQAKDGSYRWLLVSGTPSRERGVVFTALGNFTEQKQLEEQLRKQNVFLEEQNRRFSEASRLKSEFLANMSHELRSPLNGILGFTELLYDGKLGTIPERPKEYLNRIHKSAKHLLDLINAVLDLSKVEAGKIEMRPEPVRLSNIVQEVSGILGTLAAEKRIHTETSVDAEVDSVITDAARFKQILHNYLSNALKFTSEGGRVEVKLRLENEEEFRLEVSDTGIGISAYDIPRLFTQFHQLDSSPGKRYQGTGLGLALTKRIVEAQGGRVGVESVLGSGSTFYAILPRGDRAIVGEPTMVECGTGT